ncbi:MULTISPECIES: Fur family transcriptional regulator [unclassified Epibacterium]|uniref:Fur family transcriptional regulator n=1 Tax=unclassified Epibacterium TaxID=2639179 RepID=UPI001EF659BD|nr:MULTISPECIES: Fur family transcriptional regulator [unclassified Epibacterium]MCG7625706.1 transcriptional repressor [Epibacterium sp. Ofav1-8]MCG7629552.1 transcriptional repressor [Epibacterium sp. MM17-32]
MRTPARLSPEDLLCAHGLRPTRQRRALAALLFTGAGRHIDAQTLHAEATRADEKLSLATVYNALRAFEQAGLIHRVAVPGERVWFDTGTGAHGHFYIETENRVLDMPKGAPIRPPAGYRVTRIETVVHLERAADDD